MINKKDKMQLIFTFDDGPTEYMLKIAADFEKYGGHATFFVIGDKINEKTAEFMKTVISNGHEIACHGQTHGFGANPTYESVYREIDEGIKTINKFIPDYEVKYYRSAGLNQNEFMWQILPSKIKLPAISCAYNPGDWRSEVTKEDIKDRLISRILSDEIIDGDILLAHEQNTTTDIFPRILEILYNKGYGFCTISEYLKYNGINYNDLLKPKMIKNIKNNI
ncbi:MAG: polysaccharide deacetylase family protein [Clostridia bacterium]|nr:polysaccharide deacetylase family protein [Clostridia bacterium]